MTRIALALAALLALAACEDFGDLTGASRDVAEFGTGSGDFLEF